MKRPPTLVPVIAGFSVMLLLIAGVTAIGSTYVRRLSDQLTAIVAERNAKAELATAMRAIHEARYQALMLASGTADPFLRDETLMRFSRLALEFIQTRDKFLALPLDEAELHLWMDVREAVRQVEDDGEQVVVQLQHEHPEEARRRILQDLRPLQETMMARWTRLVDMQREKNEAAMREARMASTRAHQLTLILSMGAFLVGLIVSILVIRMSRRMQHDLFEEKERAEITLHAIGEAVLRFDMHGQLRYLNPVAEQLMGLDGRHAQNHTLETILHLYEKGSRADLTGNLLRDTLRGITHILPGKACLLSATGVEYEVEGTSAPIHGVAGTIRGGVLVLRDVTESRETHGQQQWLAEHDGLTGLLNRRALEDRLARALASKRAGDRPLSLLYVCLRHCQDIHDTAGQAASDELLRRLARQMRERIRESDPLARMAAHEFAILLRTCPEDMAEDIAQGLRDAIARYAFIWNGDTYRVDACLGLVQVPPHWDTDECLRAARAVCDRATHEGQDHLPSGAGYAPP
ncbi:MAG TPA: diguanylate cyclase [Thiobacillaceae bacterium]|nr:diguanylate cyclase [Thiobacillaceae bacterium]HNU64328.1 diguanylate cyclase [Thiobacillaceae bacterium]